MGRDVALAQNGFTTQYVGCLRPEITQALGINLEVDQVTIYPGAIRHMKKRHPYAFRQYFQKIPDILETPEYVGMSYQDANRLELIKKYKDWVLIALKVDEKGNLFLSSMYIIEEGRIEKRVGSGRLKKVTLMPCTKVNKQKYKNRVRCIR